MMTVRLYDPIGLLAKEKELRKLREQMELLIERENELKEERSMHLRPKPRRQKRKSTMLGGRPVAPRRCPRPAGVLLSHRVHSRNNAG